MARYRRWLAAAAVGVLLLGAVAAAKAGSFLVISLPLAQPDAIVSLASHEWERLPLAARLALENPTAVVLLTVPQRVTSFNCHDCSGRVERLRRMGVDPSRVRELPLSAPGTNGEALAVSVFARETHVRRLVVVTSPYHTRRALTTFRHHLEGSATQVGVEPAADTSPAEPTRWWRFPYDRWYVRYELLANVYYSLRYGVNPLRSAA